jgi:hypothetical protein
MTTAELPRWSNVIHRVQSMLSIIRAGLFGRAPSSSARGGYWHHRALISSNAARSDRHCW